MTGPDSRRATLAAVAREAGVSLPTVSKVVNGRPDVGKATRERIEQLLLAHDYTGWGQGRRKVTVRSLCLVFDSFENPYSMEISRGVMHAAAELGIDVTISLTSASTPGVTWADRVIRAGHEGLILVTSELSEAQRGHFARSRLPLVLIDPINLPGPEVVSIGATNWTGAVAATGHLLSLGHRRIAAIVGRPDTVFGRARLHGYRAALDDAGVPVDADLIRLGEFRYESAYQHALDLMELPDPPSAVFASSDVQALGVLEAARVLSVRVPEQLSIVSFDDTTAAQWASPPLTAVHQPFEDMGRAATDVLLQLAAGEQPASHRIELATTLVARKSTAPFQAEAKPAGTAQ
jgi:LacI family transcriptional regulator